MIRAERQIVSCDELLNSVLAAQFARAGLWQNEDMRKISTCPQEAVHNSVDNSQIWG
ncbi:hypothetical protein [Saccharopolyspora elongata]|uniref:hypothetical protein n=1 Tax=Saccharopolyspora elongata TaxID=2530387 RepID=UPI0014044899|nr:hypothetical protein [Saccharopolyspora elongata]